jgi:hypothetical protein
LRSGDEIRSVANARKEAMDWTLSDCDTSYRFEGRTTTTSYFDGSSAAPRFFMGKCPLLKGSER